MFRSGSGNNGDSLASSGLGSDVFSSLRDAIDALVPMKKDFEKLVKELDKRSRKHPVSKCDCHE